MSPCATTRSGASAIESAIAAAWRADSPSIVGAAIDVNIDAVPRTGSTSSDLLHEARIRAPATPRIRIAMEQTAGRGRMGRAWQAPAGAAILMSVAVRLARPMVDSAVTLACGVAVVETLRHGQVPAQLKWPNDILLGGRKLAGLLAELAVDGAGARTLVVGLGLNLVHPSGPQPTPPRAALADAIAIDDAGAALCVWSVRCAAAMLAAIRIVERDGFAPFAGRFDALFAWRGQPVIVIDPQRGHNAGYTAGVALGVDAAGRLRLDAGGQILAVNSGEVSLRSAAHALPDSG